MEYPAYSIATFFSRSFMVYLDYNATTPVLPEVLEAMLPYFDVAWGNPSSGYAFADSARNGIVNARAAIARLIGASSPDEIVFTSCATEANQTVVRSFLDAGLPVVTSMVEHSSINGFLGTSYEDRCVSRVGVNANGIVDLDQIDELTSGSEKGLVSIIWANNETGVISPIEEIVRIAHANGFLVHTDAVQAAGKIPVDVVATGVDYLTASAHKIYGPKGIGSLYVSEGCPFKPLLYGSQESGRRGGTESVPLIIGFGKAAEYANGEMGMRGEKTQELRKQLEEKIAETIPEAVINGKNVSRLPNTSSITLPGVDAETLQQWLSRKEIYAGTGSACTSSAPTPSHVLQAMRISYEKAQETIRISLSHLNTYEDIQTALAGIIEATESF